jgi:hypothetical protein
MPRCAACDAELQPDWRVCPRCGEPTNGLPGGRDESARDLRRFLSAFGLVTFVLGVPALTAQAVVASALDESGVTTFVDHLIWTAPLTLGITLAVAGVRLSSNPGIAPYVFIFAPVVLAVAGVDRAEVVVNDDFLACVSPEDDPENASMVCDIPWVLPRALVALLASYWSVYEAWGFVSAFLISGLLIYAMQLVLRLLDRHGDAAA